MLFRSVSQSRYLYMFPSHDTYTCFPVTIGQALARNIIAEQMLAISEKYEVVLTVHDSVVCIVKKSEQEEACELIQNFMRRRPAWAQDLPLNCEVKYGDNYGNTEKYVHVVV